MKKVLILSCSTGEGHNSAAHAIEAALLDAGISCELKDPVSFKSERMKRFVSSLYNDTIRKAPSVFGAVYKLGVFYSSTKLPSPVYWANSRYSQALRDYILDNKFNCVICTHLYGMEVMTALRKEENFSIPCYGVLTDYVCIPFTKDADLTAFFVPNEEVKQDLISNGIGSDRIIITGIPVRKTFSQHLGREQARKELNIAMDKKIFLIMTGGVGCENMERLCGEILESMRDDGQIVVLTGKNDALKSRLDARYGKSSRLKTVPFTGRVADYMAAADVLLSKPGGLSSTEAAVANVPIVHIHAIPGCETSNAKFFAGHGMAMYAENEKQAVEFAQKLAYDQQAAGKMRQMQSAYVNPKASEMIVEEVCKI